MTDHDPHSPTENAGPSQSTDSAAETAGEDSAPIRVLHVEPDPRSTELLETFAARLSAGIAVRSVDGVEAAISAVDGADAVVTEQRLPDGTGVELVERLRRDDRNVPVVFYTTCREELTEARAFGAGADAYFEKRTDGGQPRRLLERIRTLVTERESRIAPALSAAAADAMDAPGTIRSEE